MSLERYNDVCVTLLRKVLHPSLNQDSLSISLFLSLLCIYVIYYIYLYVYVSLSSRIE